MNWLTAGAIVILVLFGANAVTYRIRHGTFLKQEARSEFGAKSRLAKAGITVYTALTIALLVGFGVREATPESAFGATLQDWFTFGAYVVWCFFGATMLGVALTLCGYPSYESGIRGIRKTPNSTPHADAEKRGR